MRGYILTVLALTLGVGAVPATATSPEPSDPWMPGTSAIAVVRAVDPRFADVLDFRRAVQLQARDFDYVTTLAGSWIKVLPTFGAEWDGYDGEPSWLGSGDRMVEVMLVDDCPVTLQTTPSVDPCGWRHRWLYRVLSGGEVVLLFEDGAPDEPES